MTAAAATASAAKATPRADDSSAPGTTGTPAASATARAARLSPITRIDSARGPMNAIPLAPQAAANAARSARNPYPGCNASAPVLRAAAISASIFRYDSVGAAGPMRTATSARRTCSASRSASLYTAIERKPATRQAAAIRQAISPRLAMRTEEMVGMKQRDYPTPRADATGQRAAARPCTRGIARPRAPAGPSESNSPLGTSAARSASAWALREPIRESWALHAREC